MSDDDLEPLVRAYPNYEVLYTGHSLGGAMAMIGAFDLRRTNTIPSSTLVYTFGQPRVGNYAFSQLYDSLLSETYRIVSGRDLVPHVPNCRTNSGIPGDPLGYCVPGAAYHAGTEIWYPDTERVAGGSTGILCGHRECFGGPINEDEACSNGLILTSNVTDHIRYWDTLGKRIFSNSIKNRQAYKC
eukprot:TRINITY_DN16346_c0_g1_i1.p1 TRINITY_DN16346_c0_g1~~TRINITY_DN16346_c0_g1_i1.p1  ORF type:complete len:186 (-),score=21.79 TRINITY_DN16346_c0_g1_i1:89-646(-)